MNCRRIAALAMAFALVLPLAAQQPEPAPPLTVHQFSSELAAWQDRLAALSESPETADSLRAQLPSHWIVERDGRRMTIPTRWLNDDLAGIARRKNSTEALNDATQHIAALRREADAAESAEIAAASYSAERARMNDILSRREFAGIGPPNWLERMQQRIARWITDLLQRAVGRIGNQPTLGNILVWALVAAALIVIVLFTYRRLTRRAAAEEALDLAAPSRSLTWQFWVQQASAAAARGDFREALHCAYWAAIYRLEAAGAWRPDPARTPREYLRLLPPDSARRDPLLAVTRRFELAWYGKRDPTRADFEDSALALEKLGCPLASTKATARS